jgi:hypothetical protein
MTALSPLQTVVDVALSADDMIFGFRRDRYCKFDQSILNGRVQSFQGYGLSRVRHNPEIIPSLTSFPARIEDVTTCLYSVFTQTYKVDRVILSLSRSEFTNTSLPDGLLKWHEFGLTINWVDEDLRQYLKLLPVLKLFPSSIIITVDDNAFYPSYIFERLVSS